jgi:hypothetical protein
MGRQLRREARLWHSTLCSRSPVFWVNPQVFLHFYPLNVNSAKLAIKDYELFLMQFVQEAAIAFLTRNR